MAGRIPSQLKPKVEKICPCGKKFITSYSYKIRCSAACTQKYNSSRFKEDKNRNWKYRQTYGISLDDYNRMFAEQNGCCKICSRHQTEFNRKLGIDHDHKTSRIRGLLCQKCNHAIGLLNDDPDLIQSAKEYVLLQAA